MFQQLVFFMGLKCNLRCAYCNLDKENQNALIINSLEDFERTLSEIKANFPEKKIGKILLSGGEPTLFEKEVIRILDKYHNTYNMFIISNGVKRDVLDKYAKYNVKFIISYDGHINDRGFDSFETIEYLYNNKKLEGISMVISNENYSNIYEYVKELKEKFPEVVNRRTATNEHYRGLEINFVRKESGFYKMDLDILRSELTKLYYYDPTLDLFKSVQKAKQCKNFWKFDEDLICTHDGGFLLKKGCYERLGDKQEYEKFIDTYDSVCQKCTSDSCPGKMCPLVPHVLNVHDKEHFYCKIMRVVDEIKTTINNKEKLLGYLKDSTQFELIITNSCNLHCNYCFQREHHGNKVMSSETLRNFFERILKIKKDGHKFGITLFGGEPIQQRTLPLRKEFINLIKQYDLEDRIYVEIISNTTLLSDDEIEWLNDLKETLKGQVYWQVSLDGTKEYNDVNRVNHSGQGTFDLVINNLKKVSEILGRRNVFINSVITTSNVSGLADWLVYINDNLYEKYIDNITFRIDQSRYEDVTFKERIIIEEAYNKVVDYFEQGFIDHRLVKNAFNEKVYSYSENLTKEKDEFSSCGMCQNMMVLDVDGNLVPCHVFEGNDKYNELIIANINSNYINPKIEEIYKLYGNNEQQYSDYAQRYCYQCPMKLSCSRCKYCQYEATKDINKVLPFTCQFVLQRGIIFSERLRSLFKPLDETEKTELTNDLIELQKLYDNSTNEEEKIEIANTVSSIQSLLEVKKWYI